MGFALILLGLCFTFEPNFRMLDFFPDFIGILFVIKGLSKLSRIDGNLSDAKKNAVYLFWLSLAKLVLCMWANTGHADYLLPFTFAFCVLECMFMLSFFRNLYVGIEYTAQRCSGDRHLKSVSNAFSMAAIFTVGSRILAFLPQIIQIMAQNDELDLTYKASRRLPLSFIEPYVVLACFVLGLVLGIIYLAITAKFFSGLSRDKEYTKKLREKYSSEYLGDRERVVSDNLKGVYPLMAAGVLFFLDFSVDAVGLVPNFIGFALLLWAFARLSGIYEVKRINYTFFGIGFGIAVVNYIYMTKINLGINYLYASESFFAKEFEQIASGKALMVETVLTLLEGALFVICVFILSSALTNLFKNEKRRNGIINLFTGRIFAVVSALLFAAKNILRTYGATLSSNHEEVRRYIINKASINTEKKFLEAMENPFIRAFENAESAQFALMFLSAAAVIICAYCFISVSTKTEGTDK